MPPTGASAVGARRRAAPSPSTARRQAFAQSSPYSPRAGYITTLARSGPNAAAIKRLARHKEIKTSLRYIEATGEAFRDGPDDAF
jgi:hypothetical protein